MMTVPTFAPYEEMLRLDAVNYDTATVTRVAREHRVLNLAAGICKLRPPRFLLDAGANAFSCAAFVEDYDGPSGHVIGRMAVLAAARAACDDPDFLDIDSVLVTPGVSYGLAMVARHLRRCHGPGARVVVPCPTYPSAGQTFAHAGFAVFALHASTPADDVQGLPSAMEVIRAVETHRVQIVYLNHFNNPTGQAYSVTEFDAIIDAARAQGGTVVVDAITMDLRHQPDPLALGFRELVHRVHDRGIFVLGGLSKDRPIPGLRAGWLIARRDAALAISNANLCEQPSSVGIASAILFRDRLARAVTAGTATATSFLQVIDALRTLHCGSDSHTMRYLDTELAAAQEFGDANRQWVQRLREVIHLNLAALRCWLPAAGLRLVTEPAGGYNILLHSDDREPRDTVTLCHQIFLTAGLQLMPGETFGIPPALSQRLFTTRMSVAMEPALWQEGLARLEAALARLQIARRHA